MINDELVIQGAERDGFMISDSQVDQMLKQQKPMLNNKSVKQLPMLN